MSTRNRRARKRRNREAHAIVAVLLACAAVLLWGSAPDHVTSQFAPTGAMAAVMGVYLAIAVKRSAN